MALPERLTGQSRFPIEQILALPDTMLLLTSEVAAATRLSTSTLRKWASWKRSHDLKPFVKRGGKNLYLPSDVRRWLDLEAPESILKRVWSPFDDLP